MLTREEYSNWKIDPATKEILGKIKESIELIKEEWAQGCFCFSQTREAEARGEIKGLRSIFEITYDQIGGDEDD